MLRFRILIFLALLGVTLSASAQNFTTVSMTVTDPNGVPFSYAVVSAVLTPTTPGAYSLAGFPYSGQLPATALDATGSVTVSMGSNAAITPSGSQWLFTVSTNGIQPPLGVGGRSFTAAVTISGATQNISSTLSGYAPRLGNFVQFSPSGVPTLTLGRLSNATITGITNAAGTSTVTCDLSLCGNLQVGNVISLGMLTPASCQGPHTLTAATGNQVQFVSAACSGAGPYTFQVGQDACVLLIANAVSPPLRPVCFNLQYDNHLNLIVFQAGGTNGAELNLDGTIGTAMVESDLFNTQVGVDQNGIVCLGENIADLAGTCQGLGLDNSSGAGKGVPRLYRQLNLGTSGNGFNFGIYASPIAGNAPSGFTGNLGPFGVWTCPASGWGSQGLYRFDFRAEETSAAAGATLQFQINYTGVSGALSDNSGTAFAMAAIGNRGTFTFVVPCTPGNSITAQTVTANSPVYKLWVMGSIL